LVCWVWVKARRSEIAEIATIDAMSLIFSPEAACPSGGPVLVAFDVNLGAKFS
jgi:hypothetical protein